MPRNQRSRSAKCANRELAILSHAINTARREWGVHIANPIEGIQRPKLNRPRERRLSAEEDARLLHELGSTTRNPWIKPIVEFAIEAGMRRGEILSLTWNNVDLQRRVVRLLDTKNGEGRSVPLTLKATALISALPRSIDGRVFATTEEALKQAFERAVERARIDDLHFHDLRHEAISRLFERGLNVMEVALISGHKTLQMLKRYTHLEAEKLLVKLG
jgi:integrase